MVEVGSIRWRDIPAFLESPSTNINISQHNKNEQFHARISPISSTGNRLQTMKLFVLKLMSNIASSQPSRRCVTFGYSKEENSKALANICIYLVIELMMLAHFTADTWRSSSCSFSHCNCRLVTLPWFEKWIALSQTSLYCDFVKAVWFNSWFRSRYIPAWQISHLDIQDIGQIGFFIAKQQLIKPIAERVFMQVCACTCTHIARNLGSSQNTCSCVQSPLHEEYKVKDSSGPFKVP